MYPIKRTPTSAFIPIRNLNYHVLQWGKPGQAASVHAPLVMVHGWMDVAASYQFVVDAFSDDFLKDRTLIAPDWRGYGQTRASTASARDGYNQDNYWFPDYLADLDFLLDHFAPDQPVDLVGHSMGGNVVMLYAGSRPERIRRLINLEGFGLPASQPAQAPQRLARWMDELKMLHRGELDLTSYDDASGVARRLMKNNPRLSPDKADWLAQHWARPNEAGRWVIQGDPAHKITNAQLYRLEEVLETYRCIAAPTLSVEASENQMAQWWKGKYTLAEYHERLKQVPDLQQAVIDDAGHMLHHDQPHALAALIERFVR
jgi:pimeloyl-ACP methyl ester carboxylesterase